MATSSEVMMEATLDTVLTMSKEPKTSTVRLTAEALKWAKIASGYSGESVAEYISRTIVEQGMKDVDMYHARIKSPPAPKRKRGE